MIVWIGMILLAAQIHQSPNGQETEAKSETRASVSKQLSELNQASAKARQEVDRWELRSARVEVRKATAAYELARRESQVAVLLKTRAPFAMSAIEARRISLVAERAKLQCDLSRQRLQLLKVRSPESPPASDGDLATSKDREREKLLAALQRSAMAVRVAELEWDIAKMGEKIAGIEVGQARQLPPGFISGAEYRGLKQAVEIASLEVAAAATALEVAQERRQRVRKQVDALPEAP